MRREGQRWRRPTEVVIACALALLGLGGSALGAEPAEPTEPVVALADLDPDRRWEVESIDIEGVGFVQEWLLQTEMSTTANPWWVFWRESASFVPAYLAQDIENLRRSLQADGYYNAEVTSEIRIVREPGPAPAQGIDVDDDEERARGTPGLLAVRILIDLGEPAIVCAFYVDVGDADIEASEEPELRRRFKLEVGNVFDQATYQETAGQIAAFFTERGRPFPEVDRAARVDARTLCVDVSYRVEPGALASFGDTSIEGLDGLREELVTRELAYTQGELFDSRKVRETERRLRGLKIFSIVRLNQQTIDALGEVPMKLDLTRGPENEIRLGAGYSSEEGLRGLASWANYNFFGDGQQVSVSGRVSEITRLVSASYAQPHFPWPEGRSAITFNLGQDDESTYLDNYVRGIPQIDWRYGPDLAGTVFMRAAYDSLSGVSDQTKADLAVFQSSGFTLSMGTSIRWTKVDDILDPRRGFALGLSSELAGGPVFDADFSWLRLIANFRGYYPIAGDLVGALRLTLGTIPPYHGTPEIPLWDRFYAGGSGIYPVRGYGRRRIGPITGSNDPLGGRSLAIGSAEVRHPLIGPVLGVLFVDVGDIEKSAWTINPDNFQTGVGAGLRANSPVGPIEIDLGFGLDRPKDDSLVQVSFSIGPEF